MNQQRPALTAASETETKEFEGLPPRSDARIRVVNSRQFQIGYKLQDIGPSGISDVELYITQDQGEKWWKYGEDADRQSPFQVEVPTEGTFGFTLLVRSGVGLGADPPQPGEKPAMVIVVDETPPQPSCSPSSRDAGQPATEL